MTKPISATGSVIGLLEVTRVDNSNAELLGLSLTTTVDRRDFGPEIAAGAGWELTIDTDLELREI